MLNRLRKKTIASLSIFSLLLNLFQPFIITAPYFIPTQAHAQEEIVVEEETVVVEDEVIVEEAPPAEESPAPIVVELTPIEPSPEPEPETNLPLEDLPEEVIEEEPLPEPDLTPPQEETSAQIIPTITTDKLDYAPTESAIITGSDLEPNITYILRVSSQDPPATSFETEVTTDDSGSLAYTYQLDGIYRPDYLVEVFDIGSALVATTTFTDSVRINICHRTSSHSNPYNFISVDSSSIIEGPNGHAYHDGDIWHSGIPNHSWGDIIPPFDYDDNEHYDGKNWPEGELVLLNGCNFPGEPEPSSLTIVKDEIPDSGGAFLFLISGPDSYDADFTLSDDGSSSGDETVTLLNLSPGDYTIDEINSALPYSTTVSCSNDTSDTDHNITVSLGEGDNITCTFTNTLVTGFLQGRKYLDDNQDGLMQEGEVFMDDWTINLYDANWEFIREYTTGDTGNDGQYRFDGLTPNTYHTCEVMQDGWFQTGPNLGDYATNYQVNPPYGTSAIAVANLSSNATEGSVCWQAETVGTDIGWLGFGNIQQGSIIIEKYTNPSDSEESFEFQTNYSDSLFSLKHGQHNNSGDLAPGIYSVSETVPDGWTQTQATCDDGSSPDSINLAPGETITCTFINTEHSSISGYKLEDIDGVLGCTTSAVPLWDIELWLEDNLEDTTTTDSLGYYSFTNLLPGNYFLKEIMQTGWTNVLGTSTELNAPLSAGEVSEDNNFINTQYGSIQGRKYQDVNGNGDFDQIEKDALGDPNRLDDWTISLYDTNFITLINRVVTGDDTTPAGNVGKGQYRFVDVYPGTYNVCETQQSDWTQTEPSSGPIHFDSTHCHVVTVNSGQVVEGIQFGNYQDGDLTVIKYSDYNGNGEQDDGEPLLSDWEMNLYQGEQLGSELTNQDGEALFPDLTPGNYYLSETYQTGWTQTSIKCDLEPIYPTESDTNPGSPGKNKTFLILSNLRIESGQSTTCKVGNQQDPALTISKSNDSSGDKSSGDTVTFTLTVELTGSNLRDVQVVDLPATGFTYQLGSWTGTSTEPTYASPGTWILGDMTVGEIITLTYQAKIDSDVDPGDYRDLAYAHGCKYESEEGCEELVYAIGIDSDYLEEHFVGTSVSVGGDSRETGSVDIEREGEVLGVTISLPATGTDSNWLYLALTLIFSGLVMIFGGKYMRKLLLPLILITTFLSPTSVLAVNDPSLSIRIESPDSPTRVNHLDLAFTVLDLESRPVTATCYVKSPDSSSYIQFDTVKSLSAGGNHDSCSLDSSIMTTQGDYELYVTADAGSGVEESDHVTVTYDTEGPGQPTSFNKSRPWSCRYTIQFHTASDNGLTEWVEIFGSTSTSFSTDNSTRVGSVGIGSDDDGEFHHDLTGDDCNLEWYYVIRAFDSAGNQSAHIGDEVITSTTIVTETIEESTSLPTGLATGTVLGEQEDSDEQGEILGDDSPDEPIEPEQVNITSWIQDNIDEAQSSPNRFYILSGLIIFFGIIYVFIRRYRK